MEIYKITNLINHKVYIGKDATCDKNYYGSGVFIKSAIKKYGKKNFMKEIIDRCDSYEELSVKEKYWISFYREREELYNIADGGDGGDTWSSNPKFNELREKYYKPIIIDGIEYESITMASKFLNLERSHIRHRLKSFNFKNYLYKDNNINIKNNKFVDKFESKRKKISINGVIYFSISDACSKINKTHDYILWRLQSKSYVDWFYLDVVPSKETNRPKKMKSVSINGESFDSISDAVLQTGVNRQIMRYRLRSEKYTEYYFI